MTTFRLTKMPAIKMRNLHEAEHGCKHHIQSDTYVIENALQIALEKLAGMAKDFRNAETASTPLDGGGNLMLIDVTSARRVAEDFERQASQVEHVLDMMRRGDGMVILNVEPDEDDLEQPEDDAEDRALALADRRLG